MLYGEIMSVDCEDHKKSTKIHYEDRMQSVQGLSQNCDNRLFSSSCLSVRTEQLGSHWTDFDNI